MFFSLNNMSRVFSVSIEIHLHLSNDYQAHSGRKSMYNDCPPTAKSLGYIVGYSVDLPKFILMSCYWIFQFSINTNISIGGKWHLFHFWDSNLVLLTLSSLPKISYSMWLSPCFKALRTAMGKAEFLNKTIQNKTKHTSLLHSTNPFPTTHITHKRKCAGWVVKQGGDKSGLDRAWKAFRKSWETISMSRQR